MLLEQKYDIWIGNSRGNIYSFSHVDMVNHNPNNYSSAFWDFSWDELGKYDLPATLDFIKGKTGFPKIKYVCHSQGCTMLFALAFERPDYINENIDLVSAFAPAVHAYYQVSVGVDLFRLAHFGENFIGGGLKNLFAQSAYQQISEYVARVAPNVWMLAINFLAGWTDKFHIDTKRLHVLAAHEPGGSSIFAYNHFVQGVYNSTVQWYDFGREGNIRKYGQPTPPVYNVANLKKLNVRWYFVYGEKDSMVAPKGMRRLFSEMREGYYEEQMMMDANHLDVCWSD